MLASKCRSWKLHSLLVRILKSAATLENSLALLNRLSLELQYDQAIPLLGNMVSRIGSICSNKNLYMIDNSSIVILTRETDDTQIYNN
jgi:hypothetical protein